MTVTPLVDLMRLQRSSWDWRSVDAAIGAARAAGRRERPVVRHARPSDCGTAQSARLQPEDDPGIHPRGRHGAAKWIAQMTKQSRDCAAAAAASSTPPLAHLFRPPRVSTTARPAMTRPRQARREAFAMSRRLALRQYGPRRQNKRPSGPTSVPCGEATLRRRTRFTHCPSGEAISKGALEKYPPLGFVRFLRTAIQGSPLPTPEHPAATEHSTQWENFPGTALRSRRLPRRALIVAWVRNPV